MVPSPLNIEGSQIHTREGNLSILKQMIGHFFSHVVVEVFHLDSCEAPHQFIDHVFLIELVRVKEKVSAK